MELAPPMVEERQSSALHLNTLNHAHDSPNLEQREPTKKRPGFPGPSRDFLIGQPRT